MKITVLGAAKSGFSAAILANKLGYEVFVSELGQKDKFLNEIKTFYELGISFEFGENTEKILDCDFVITSPGVPPSSYPMKILSEKNKEIISELEFAYQHLQNKENIIAITGTNGKTTTTSLIHHILSTAGKSAVLSGNIGIPLSDLVLDLNNNQNNLSKDTIIVIEASSYQLDKIKNFAPKVGLLLNISPDHLAYHGDINNYVDAKWKISLNMNKNNFLILNNDDVTLINKLNSLGEEQNKFTLKTFSINNTESDIYVENDHIIINSKQSLEASINTKEELMNIANLSLPGVHNLYNSLAAILAVRAFEVRNEDIRDALQSFKSVEHRLEFVNKINNITFVNDSKATNVNSTWYALSSYKQPIIWIAGGRGDNNNYNELNKLVKLNVKLIIAIGEEADSICNSFNHLVEVVKANDLKEAVYLSIDKGNSGDIALFSPSCKSFDMFANYEHRGRVFKDAVNSFINSSNNTNNISNITIQ